jgi:hypothetical protein
MAAHGPSGADPTLSDEQLPVHRAIEWDEVTTVRVSVAGLCCYQPGEPSRLIAASPCTPPPASRPR